MNWRPVTEQPQTSERITALIASRDEEGEFYLVGIYYWRDGWRDEITDTPLPAGEYWWHHEEELLADLRLRVPA